MYDDRMLTCIILHISPSATGAEAVKALEVATRQDVGPEL